MILALVLMLVVVVSGIYILTHVGKTVKEYKKLVSDIFNKKVAVSNSIDKQPAVTVKVNYYQNIK